MIPQNLDNYSHHDLRLRTTFLQGQQLRPLPVDMTMELQISTYQSKDQTSHMCPEKHCHQNHLKYNIGVKTIYIYS